MTTQKHTPGPYHVETWRYDMPGRGAVPVIVAGKDAIGEAYSLWREGADDSAERAANARLFAAADDLFWLAERAQAIRTAEGWSKAERERSWQEWESHYQAAMAKLSGEA